MSGNAGDAPWGPQAGQSPVGPAPVRPVAPAAAPPPSPAVTEVPLQKIERAASWSIACAFASVIFGFLTLVPALILAFRAQNLSRAYTYTSANSRVRWAKGIAIGATVVWVLIIILIAASGGS